MRAVFFVSLLVMGVSAQAAELLLYSASEPGAEAAPSRIITTEQYLRMDDGVDGGDFILLDRRSGTVLSVSHADATVFAVEQRPVAIEPPVTLVIESGDDPLGKGVPPIGGRRPEQHTLRVNGEACHHVVAVPGLLEDSVRALRQFRQTLAGQHARTLLNTPADLFAPVTSLSIPSTPTGRSPSACPSRSGVRAAAADGC